MCAIEKFCFLILTCCSLFLASKMAKKTNEQREAKIENMKKYLCLIEFYLVSNCQHLHPPFVFAIHSLNIC